MLDQAMTALKEFHDAASIKITGQRPQNFKHMSLQAKIDKIELRENLIAEENKEVEEALDNYEDALISNVGTLDECRKHLVKELADILYVCIGTAVDLDLDLSRAFAKVHRNNMAKLATATIREDGKLVKAKDHPHPNLDDCI